VSDGSAQLDPGACVGAHCRHLGPDLRLHDWAARPVALSGPRARAPRRAAPDAAARVLSFFRATLQSARHRTSAKRGNRFDW